MNIENELKKFNVSDTAIVELSTQYLPLKINGIDDKEGHNTVKAAERKAEAERIAEERRLELIELNRLAAENAKLKEQAAIAAGEAQKEALLKRELETQAIELIKQPDVELKDVFVTPTIEENIEFVEAEFAEVGETPEEYAKIEKMKADMQSLSEASGIILAIYRYCEFKDARKALVSANVLLASAWEIYSNYVGDDIDIELEK